MKKVAILIAIYFVTLSYTKNSEVAAEMSQLADGDGSHVLNLDELDLNKENLLRVLDFYNVKNSDIVYRQAILETGNFSSSLCKSHNNLFGMFLPAVRKTVAVGKNKTGYARYTHWTKSVEDYKLWQDMSEVSDTTDYYKYLKRRGYSTSPHYVKRLKRIRVPKLVQ